MSTAILYTATAGVPGDLNDILNTVVESCALDPSNPPLAYGVPVKLVSGKVNAIEAGDDATDFYGILSRSVPTASGSLVAEFNSVTPNPNTVSGVVVGGPGYVKVFCKVGTPVKGASVYMRVVAAGPNLVGDLEADADGNNNVLLPSVIWAVSGVDSDLVSSVRVNGSYGDVLGGIDSDKILTSYISTPDVAANLVSFDIVVSFSSLFAGAEVPLYASSGAKRYVIRALWSNAQGVDFGGGGGDRLLSITDNNTDYSIIPAASLQSEVNSGWGSAGLPYPPAIRLNAQTAAGDDLVAKYFGGSTDYTFGNITISGLLERVV